MRARIEAGFTFVELAIAIAITATVLGVSVAVVPPVTEVMQADADLQAVKSQIVLAREAAIKSGAPVEIEFTAPNILESFVRKSGERAVMGRVVLGHGAEFQRLDGMPDTPDAFGAASALFSAGRSHVTFTPRGVLVDEAGATVNATIFIGQPARPATLRVVTIFGEAARVRGYRWSGGAWRP
jgi:Tfp pilus assembly protein FimT